MKNNMHKTNGKETANFSKQIWWHKMERNSLNLEKLWKAKVQWCKKYDKRYVQSKLKGNNYIQHSNMMAQNVKKLTKFRKVMKSEEKWCKKYDK